MVLLERLLNSTTKAVLTALALLGLCLPAAAQSVHVAAAANIKFALDDIAERYQQETGRQLKISYGSSGNFVAQIKHGAPFELFLSADERYVDALADAGITRDKGVVYAYGRLALVAPKNSPLKLDQELLGLQQALAAGRSSALPSPTRIMLPMANAPVRCSSKRACGRSCRPTSSMAKTFPRRRSLLEWFDSGRHSCPVAGGGAAVSGERPLSGVAGRFPCPADPAHGAA